MNTTENNKKLAIFMNNAITDSNNNHKDTYNYHNDWNCLMEVVEKILTVGDDTDQWDNVLNELQTVNRNNVYNACIEFVEWLGKEEDGEKF